MLDKEYRAKMKRYIEKWLVEYQHEKGCLIPLQDFATHLGMDRSTLSHIYNGKRMPTVENCFKFYTKTGDPEVFAIAGHEYIIPFLK